MSETNQWNRMTFHYCIESQSSLLLHLHTQSEASNFLKSKPINLVHHSVWLLLMFLSPRKNNIANSPFRKKSIAAVDFEMKSNLMVEASDQVPYNVQLLMQHETVYEFFLCQFFFPFGVHLGLDSCTLYAKGIRSVFVYRRGQTFYWKRACA